MELEREREREPVGVKSLSPSLIPLPYRTYALKGNTKKYAINLSEFNPPFSHFDDVYGFVSF